MGRFSELGGGHSRPAAEGMRKVLGVVETAPFSDLLDGQAAVPKVVSRYCGSLLIQESLEIFVLLLQFSAQCTR